MNYGLSFDEVKALAQKENRPFCIVLSKGDCPPCAILHDELQRFKRKAVINIINTSSPGNRWYEQWVGTVTSPLTCIFSASGELMAIVTGATGKSLECIEQSIDGQPACSDFMFRTAFTSGDNMQTFKTMDKILNARQAMQKGEDMGNSLEQILSELQYPYAVYLQYANSKKQGKEEEAIYYAKQLLTFNQPQYLVLYKDMYIEAKKTIDPGFDPALEGKLQIESDKIELNDCKVNVAKPFRVKLTNAGKKELKISDITVSCTCVKITGDKQHVLMPSESVEVDFMFTADYKGDITRHINIVTDVIGEPMTQITILAKAN